SKLDESDFYKFLDSFEVLGNPPAVANAPINNLPPPNWGGDMVKPLLPHLEKPIEWPQLPEVPVPKPPDERGAPPWTPQPPRFQVSPADATKLQGLVAYWALDEGKGTQVADKSGRSPAGKVVGGWWIDGVRGKAVLFDGRADYLDLGESPALNIGDKQPFTLSLWVA